MCEKPRDLVPLRSYQGHPLYLSMDDIERALAAARTMCDAEAISASAERVHWSAYSVPPCLRPWMSTYASDGRSRTQSRARLIGGGAIQTLTLTLTPERP